MFLEDMLEASNKIERYLTGISYKNFLNNEMLIDVSMVK